MKLGNLTFIKGKSYNKKSAFNFTIQLTKYHDIVLLRQISIYIIKEI